MRISELDINYRERAAKELEAFKELMVICHTEVKNSSDQGECKFPRGIGESYTFNMLSLIDSIVRGGTRIFFIYNDNEEIVGFSDWRIGYCMYNVGYKTALLCGIYIPKEMRNHGETMKKMLLYASQTLKRDGFDTFIAVNDNTVLDKAINKMGLELNSKEYRI